MCSNKYCNFFSFFFIYVVLMSSNRVEIKITTTTALACENSRLSTLLAPGEVLLGETSAPKRQELHTDDVNQCLHDKSDSHGVPNLNLLNFMFLLVDYGKVLCSLANELQQNSNASAREEYIPRKLTVL